MHTNELRKKFLNYFKKQGHAIVPSDSLIPSADPSLLFTSAGMVQFKKHFLGQIRLDFRRAASSQKCLRTTDIDRVGFTARHLTFFEMLGNFSFGDYFKKEAIAWGWEFLTSECGLEPERLYPSIYKEDDESFGFWKKIVPESRIVRLGEDSNFWNMGPTGPCGPCSEILYDQGEKFGCGKSSCGPGCDCDRYLEVWNLVFTQFDRQSDGKLVPLPQKNIDTGMGLERLSAVTNHLPSNFDIDIFQKLVSEIRNLIQSASIPQSANRIIADHIRASTFLISDGILPSNEGRGYILRRLLRRALRQGWIHGRKDPFLHLLVPVVAKEMGEAYPELTERTKNIQSIIETEEKNTLQTIESGTRYLMEQIKSKSGSVKFPGEKVFYIYDTYGLDKEIQKEILADSGIELVFSEQEYEKARERAVETARRGWKGSGQRDVTIYSKVQKKTGAILFRGYEVLETQTKVLAVLKEKKSDAGILLEEVQELSEGDEGEVILAETPFYAESGGQVGDRGLIENGGNVLEVLDTQKPVEGLIVHRIRVKNGSVKAGDAVKTEVDAVLRRHTMRHHTATHLLHAALRKVLGSHVTQAGSLVSPEKLRFDFTYPKALKKEEITQIEKLVNEAVLSNIPRKRDEYSLEEARKHGALAFFGEKYGEKVFVVNYDNASTEVCGGTHCHSTGEIGLFKVTSESSVGSGVRRIEALAGEKALEYVQDQESQLEQIAEKLKCSESECIEKIDKAIQRQTELEREITNLKKNRNQPEIDLSGEAKSFSLRDGKAFKFAANAIESADADQLRETADIIRNKLGSGVVLLASQEEDKSSFVVTITKDCAANGLHAGKIATEFARKIGGRGGGKELFAQGGGKSVSDLKKIVESFPEEFAALLKKSPASR